jgi:tRNA (guanine37-N1)-methyltransferase
MVLRVDVVCAALEAVYGGPGGRRIVALSPQGRLLDQDLVEELAREDELAILSARFEGFDERIVEHVATDAVSIGRYVLSGGELPAMVLVDAIGRRLPGTIRAESGAVESFSAELEGGVEFPHYTRPPEFRGWKVPDVLLSGDHARIAAWRRERSRSRTAS